jgi:hypothetical protein
MSPASPVRDARPTPFGAGVRPRAARVSDPAVRVTEGLSALSNSSLARFDVAALGSCPQCARQIGPYVFESHGLFRPFRARRKVVDAVPQGVPWAGLWLPRSGRRANGAKPKLARRASVCVQSRSSFRGTHPLPRGALAGVCGHWRARPAQDHALMCMVAGELSAFGLSIGGCQWP